jgi:hypothetical protein
VVDRLTRAVQVFPLVHLGVLGYDSVKELGHTPGTPKAHIPFWRRDEHQCDDGLRILSTQRWSCRVVVARPVALALERLPRTDTKIAL